MIYSKSDWDNSLTLSWLTFTCSQNNFHSSVSDESTKNQRYKLEMTETGMVPTFDQLPACQAGGHSCWLHRLFLSGLDWSWHCFLFSLLSSFSRTFCTHLILRLCLPPPQLLLHSPHSLGSHLKMHQEMTDTLFVTKITIQMIAHVFWSKFNLMRDKRPELGLTNSSYLYPEVWITQLVYGHHCHSASISTGKRLPAVFT